MAVLTVEICILSCRTKCSLNSILLPHLISCYVSLSQFTLHYTYMVNVAAGIPSNIKYPNSNSTLSTKQATKQPHERDAIHDKYKSSGEWRIILYIVLVTIVVIIVVLIALGIYRMTLIKSLRVNRGRHLSKLVSK